MQVSAPNWGSATLCLVDTCDIVNIKKKNFFDSLEDNNIVHGLIHYVEICKFMVMWSYMIKLKMID